MTHYGDYEMTDTVYVVFNTFTSDDPSASATITNLADGDIHIHKDGSATQRSSGSGVTVSTDFDSITGNHLVAIDLSDNTDAGYYGTGSTYIVRMEGTTVDAATINAWIGSFTIGKTRAMVREEVGLAGSSLTAIPWNSDWDSEVESEVIDGIAAGTALVSIPWNAAWDAEVESEVIDGIAAGTALVSIPWNAAWDAEVESEVVDGIAAGTALVSIPWNAAWDAEVESEVIDGIAAGTALVSIPWNAAWDTEVESEVTDSLVAHNLDHLALTATAAADMTAEVADNTILSRMLASGDTSGFVPSTDGLQPIRDSITAAADASYNPDVSSTVTDGTVISGTYASCAADDGTDWVIQMESDNDTNVDVTCEFNMGANRRATEIDINGNFDAGGVRSCQIYAWNYTTGAWDKLSSPGADTEMRNSAADRDYVFALGQAHTDETTTPGEVKIRFYTDGDASDEDDLRLDYVAITGIATGGTTPQAIAQAVHTELDGHLKHLMGFTGEVLYIDGTDGTDGNSGDTPDEALATIGAGIIAGTAGSMLVVRAGTYSENGLDMSKAGMELHGELGASISTASGDQSLLVSAANCRVNGFLISGSGRAGVKVTAAGCHIFETTINAGATIGFDIDSSDCWLDRCQVALPTASGFDFGGGAMKVNGCFTIGNTTTIGFRVSAGNLGYLKDCSSNGHETAGYQVDSGVNDVMIIQCASGPDDGSAVDNGTSIAWRDFMDSASDAADAIAAVNLDHLMLTGDATLTNIVADNTALAHLMATGADISEYSATTDALQSIRDVAPHGTAMRGTDSAALATVATESRLAELDAGNLPTDIAAIPTTAMRGTDSAATEAKQDIIDGVVDAILAMLDDARAEPGQGAPAVNPDAMTKIDYLYKAWRNKTTSDSDSIDLYNDAGAVVDQKSTISDDGSTFTRGEMGTGA